MKGHRSGQPTVAPPGGMTGYGPDDDVAENQQATAAIVQQQQQQQAQYYNGGQGMNRHYNQAHVHHHQPLLPNPSLSPTTAAILEGLDDDDSEDDEGLGETGSSRGHEKRSGRRKIKIEYIEEKSRRHITFSKRKAGIMKKVHIMKI